MNHPLNVDSTKVYLIGHGYAPVFRVTDGRGKVVYDQATPFLPADQSTYLSEGVVKAPDAKPQQLGFAGVFLPTAVDVNGQLESAFPAPYEPAVSMIPYSGNLGLNSGVPQSVYQLNTTGMHRIARTGAGADRGPVDEAAERRGHAHVHLGYKQWASLQVTYDPGQVPALISGIVALVGLVLSFLVRRRRIFVRAYRGDSGRTVVDVGGLARSDVGGGFEAEFASWPRPSSRFITHGHRRGEPTGSAAVTSRSRSRPARRPESTQPAPVTVTSPTAATMIHLHAAKRRSEARVR